MLAGADADALGAIEEGAAEPELAWAYDPWLYSYMPADADALGAIMWSMEEEAVEAAAPELACAYEPWLYSYMPAGADADADADALGAMCSIEEGAAEP
jgi:hypothetical protein